MKIDNIESAIAAIESAGYKKMESHIIEEGSYIFSLEKPPYLYGVTGKDELFEFARKCQLRAFW